MPDPNFKDSFASIYIILYNNKIFWLLAKKHKK